MVEKIFWEDLKWGESHHTELLRSYEDQWVAIVDKKVISAGTNLAKVKQEAEIKAGKKEIPVIYVDCGQHIYGQN